MHLLYVDESGLVTDSRQKFFVLAGVSVFEKEPHWIDRDLEQIAARFSANDPDTIELHGSPMRSGKGRWRSVAQADRDHAIADALTMCVVKRFPRHARLFAAVLEKAHLSGEDITQVAFEQVSSRFDHYLRRLHLQGDTQRGLIVFDKCSTERRIQSLAREFKRGGHSFGVTRNFAEIPVFVDSQASRLIQLADLVAYSLLRHFEHQDSTFYNLISQCFDTDGGVKHGLYVR